MSDARKPTSRSTRAQLKGIFGRVLLVIAGSIVAIIMVEALLRLQEPHFHLMGMRAQYTLGKTRPHPVWDHGLLPNMRVEVPSLNEQYWPAPMLYQTNAQGCRHSRDLIKRAPAGVKRIIVMGDSFTEGYYQDSTFAAILDRQLNLRGDSVMYEVVNCGTTSYSPLLYYLRYKHDLANYHPDELIVNIDLTDIYDDYERYTPRTRFASDGEPLMARPDAAGPKRIVDELRFRFYFARLLFRGQRRESPSLVSNIYAYHSTLTPDSARWRDAANVSLSYLQRLIDLTREQGVQLTLTTYPWQRHFRPGDHGEPLLHRGWEQEIRALAERNGIQYWSAYDGISRWMQHPSVTLYWSGDFHFTPHGQNVWGHLFAQYYLDRMKS